jgi:large subunit ribosomal protein L29
MASKKFIELQEMKSDDLANEIVVTQQQLQKLRFDHAVKGLDNPMVLREIKKDIARLKSEQRRREVSEMSPEDLANRSRIRSRRRKN